MKIDFRHGTTARLTTLAAALLVVGALGGCTTAADTGGDAPASVAGAAAPATSAPETSSAPASDAQSSSEAEEALAALSTIPVKGRAPKTGYSRDEFGQRWSDDVPVEGGHNGCDTRNDILLRDLENVTFKPGTRECVVLSGTLHDPYTGETIEFTRGQDTSSAVQIDHIVALSDAWQKGAQQLSEDERRAFANDPRNLQAADGPANQQKGDGDAATWLPPNRSYRCTYVARQVEVKAAYQLWVTQAEHDAMTRVLSAC